MKRVIGYTLFFIGLGMALMLLLPTNLWTVSAILGLLIIGYNLFCSCPHK